MDINKSENLIDNSGQKPNELKEVFEDDSNKESGEAEIPKEVQLNYNKPVNGDSLDNKKADLVSLAESDGGEPIGKKAMDSLLLNLNSYWLELMGSISLIVSLLIYEIIGLIAVTIIFPLFQGEIDFNYIQICFNFIIKDIGLKWLFFITMSQHLSVGFFCLTTFSNVFNETINIKKFYISNCIKVAIFYVISVIILKVIVKDGIGGTIHEKIDATGNPDRERIYGIFDRLIDKAMVIVADFLSTYNTFIEKLTLGSMYIFLFYDVKSLEGKKRLYFRLLALIPVIYILVSLILRALHNTKVIELSEYVSPLLLGPKITVYLFFIITLSLIKYKSIAFNVFDSENYISPKVFTNIGSKIFGILGVIELIIGLFLPSWSAAGIGGKYLLVICAPIMTLYDYKRKYTLKFPCCGKGNFTLCLKLVINIIGYTLIIILGILIFVFAVAIFAEYVGPIIELMIEYIDIVGEVLDMIL